jgi:hypothetical protein
VEQSSGHEGFAQAEVPFLDLGSGWPRIEVEPGLWSHELNPYGCGARRGFGAGDVHVEPGKSLLMHCRRGLVEADRVCPITKA